MADKSLCKIDGCGKSARTMGWCGAHYHRYARHGHPLAGRVSNGEPYRHLREVVLAYDGNECLIWPYARIKAGYAQLGGGKYVHRLACEELYGPPPTPEHEAAHSCGNGHLGCVAKRHLSWKTHAENMADKLIHGTHNRGERQGRSKLTEANVREIRQLNGIFLDREIAAIFGVSRGTINDIMRRTTWGWL